MASDRDKLTLDEQSFEGLLAAAFTIQQHNERMNAAGVPALASTQKNESADLGPAATPEAKPDVLICGGCGAALPSAGATCLKCGRTNFRPGERLQRNWASLWQMSQEQGTGLEARRKPEDDLELSPADPGRRPAMPHRGSDIVDTVDHCAADHSQPDAASQTVLPLTEPARASLRIHAGDGHQADQFESIVTASEAVRTRPPELAIEGVNRPEEAAEVDTSDAMKEEEFNAEHSSNLQNGEVTRDGTIDRDNLAAQEHALVHEDAFLSEALTGRDDEMENAWHQAEANPRVGTGIFSALRTRIAAHRADIFLGLAIIIAAAALLWPTGGESGPRMAPWERVLVAMGIAEAPRPVVHYYGDPNLKVWVDTHTALYYCPGDELYGKSPDGHYTTQREAQADQFQPAERSVCIE